MRNRRSFCFMKPGKKERNGLLFLALLSFVPLLVMRLIQPMDSEITFHPNRVLFRQEIQKLIPVGSDIRAAKALLERNGCSCSILTDGRFHPNRTLEEAAKKSKVNASLECLRQKPDYLIFRRHWVVITKFRKLKVNGVVAFTRSTISSY